MPTKQGSLDLLDDPIAQEMLQAPIPLRLAYNWLDGSPRVVPIGFHWNGLGDLYWGASGCAQDEGADREAKVAVTIDSNTDALITSC